MQVALGTVVLTQTKMWEERRWLTPLTTLGFPCSPQTEAIDLTQKDNEGFDGVSESADVFFEALAGADDVVRPCEPPPLAPPSRPKPSSGGPGGSGFSRELNISGGKLLY